MTTTILQKFGLGLLWLYIALLLAWWMLHLLLGDTIWWLGLISSFVPLLLAPLLIFLPLAGLIRNPLYTSGLLIPLTFFLYYYGPSFLPKTIPAHLDEPAPLTIMTFNMWAGSHKATTVDLIRQQGLPDIVALQETTPVLNRLIDREVGDAYPYRFYEFTDNGRGISTLSRYPLESTRSSLIIDLNCRVFRATVDPTHHFWLYNCHPESSNLFNFLGDGRPMNVQIRETFQMRRRLSQALAEDIAARQEPSVVVGDFNSTEQSDAYALLRDQLQDAHRQAGWGFGHTF
ncbi:MAG: endonuclease/exonuclease/phosphatase family protein, partial [Caldilineaceae bacterium]|nr:endonuclease/exonuclease/phosphatase family protein [Caldilineaceae bacterium]